MNRQDVPFVSFPVQFWAFLWKEAHGRRPMVSELPVEHAEALGEKVFEYLDYRDKHHPVATDELIYEGCLEDHGVDRDRPDGVDFAKEKDAVVSRFS